MTGHRTGPAFANYCDSVKELIESEQPFAVVEDMIDDFGELSEDTRAALWLLAFVTHEQRRDGRPHRLHSRSA
jgi:hypothetical protein